MAFCSLINKAPQVIEPATYTALRFGPDESTDRDGWHESTDVTKRTSALIVPRVTAVGWLWAKVAWEDPRKVADVEGGNVPSKYYAKIVRDPWTARADQTGAQHFAAVPGSQNHVTSWLGTLRDGQPLALMVMHNGDRPLNVVLSEFKAWIP